MMLTILLVFLTLNLTRAYQISVSKNYTTFNSSIINLCQAGGEFKYYHELDNDNTKYIQCDPWGTYEIKSCEKNHYWNSWEYKCTEKSDIKNLTLITIPNSLVKDSINFDCNMTDSVCLNDGICSEVNGKYRCVCKTNFTGQFCEKNTEIIDIYHDILSKTFSIDSYKNRMIDEDLTNNVTYYEKYEDVLSNTTYEELMNYLSYFNESANEIRYDTLMNTLVQDIIREIFPDIEFLITLNASANNMLEMVKLIHDLLSYGKYYNHVYLKAFNEYEKVLNSLVEILNKTSIEKYSYKKEAKSYKKLTLLFLNQTSYMFKNHKNNDNTSNDDYFKLYTQSELFPILSMPKSYEVREYLKIKFNSTLSTIMKMHAMFYPIQVKILNEISLKPLIKNETLAKMSDEWPELRSLIMFYDELSLFGSQIWDVLVNYGFWHLTNSLCNFYQ